MTDEKPLIEPGAPAASEPEDQQRHQATHWELAQTLRTAGASRQQIQERLQAAGLDEESAMVLCNAVLGGVPSELPTVQLPSGTHALAPKAFVLSEMGLAGPPRVVGLYWIFFGLSILLGLAVCSVVTAAGLVEVPPVLQYYGPRLAGLLSVATMAWGALTYSRGVAIRRR